MEITKEELKAKREAQQKYCYETDTPHFAPVSGVCWSCRKNIYLEITMEKASTQLITGCPHCHKSFVD